MKKHFKVLAVLIIIGTLIIGGLTGCSNNNSVSGEQFNKLANSVQHNTKEIQRLSNDFQTLSASLTNISALQTKLGNDIIAKTPGEITALKDVYGINYFMIVLVRPGEEYKGVAFRGVDPSAIIVSTDTASGAALARLVIPAMKGKITIKYPIFIGIRFYQKDGQTLYFISVGTKYPYNTQLIYEYLAGSTQVRNILYLQDVNLMKKIYDVFVSIYNDYYKIHK